MPRIAFAPIAIAALVSAACGGGAGAPSGATTLAITMKEFSFAPNKWDVPAGSQVKLQLKNSGTVEHDFTVQGANVTVSAPVGRTVEKTVAPLAAGTYQVLCSVTGHKEAGMVGTLTVK